MKEILQLLKEKFNSDKAKTWEFLKSHGVEHWPSFEASETDQARILNVLKDTREWKTFNINSYTITRPVKPRNVSEVSFNFKGLNV